VADNMIIVGTIGKSSALDELSRSGKIDLAQISGTWNLFSYKLSRRLCLVSAKPSSLRGATSARTIYGIYDLSEQIGVSPWYWWADAAKLFWNYLLPRRLSEQPQLAAMRGPRTEKPRETDPREGNPVYNAAYLRVQKGSVR